MKGSISMKVKSLELRKNWPGYLFVAPAVILVLLLSIYPLLYGILISFLHFDMTHSNAPNFGSFAGLQNYIKIIGEPEFWNAMGNTVIWTISNLGLQVVLAMILALLLNQRLVGRSVFRTIALIPWAIPSVIAALTFGFLYDTKVGILNILSVKLGFVKEAIPWLGNPQTAMPAVIAESVWKGIPFLMILILAALQAIAPEIYESAGIDGANRWQQFWRITFPMIKEPFSVAVILTLIGVVNSFNSIWLLTQGGPLGRTDILYTYAYRISFNSHNFGNAAAVSVILFVIIAVLSVFYIRMIRRND